jgi:anti-sigma regulatory factor (Ser/Thr protein kinase)
MSPITDNRAAEATRTNEVLLWHRSFPGRLDQAAELRHFVGFLLGDLSNINEIIEVTAELTNNALIHSDSGKPGGRITAEVRRWPGSCASIAISDGGGTNEPSFRQMSDPAALDDLTEGGRGLPIVTAYSSWWGWEGGVAGRTVTAFFLPGGHRVM